VAGCGRLGKEAGAPAPGPAVRRGDGRAGLGVTGGESGGWVADGLPWKRGHPVAREDVEEKTSNAKILAQASHLVSQEHVLP